MAKTTKTPIEILAEELERSGIDKTDLGRRLGSKAPYLYVRDILKGRKAFTPALQLRVADVLGKPPTFFSNPAESVARERYIKETFAAFLKTEIGEKLDADTRRTIELIPFLGSRLPTVALYQAIALALRGDLTADQAVAAAALNEALDAEIAKRDKRKK